MSNVLVINVTGQETRVALIEHGILAELYIERKYQRGIVGNIYRGRVVRVLPGMQAAFVDIGTDRAAFLYVNDVLNEHIPFDLSEDEPAGAPDEAEVETEPDTSEPETTEAEPEPGPENTLVDLTDPAAGARGRRRRP